MYYDMSLMFHPRTGELVVLSNGNRTAQRKQPLQEFNNGLVVSLEPLRDNQLFEVRIDRKINSWTGSIEIGVTTCDPCSLEFPSSAAELREQSWVMSGNSVLKDGQPTVEEYGQNLDSLEEGDKVGVMRTPQSDLHFFINGTSQGVAATNIPSKVHAVVDMYGKCVQVTILENVNEARLLANEINNESTLASNFTISSAASNNNNNNSNTDNSSRTNANGNSSTNLLSGKLHFHKRTGQLVRLTNNNRTAERQRPFDEFNNGIVMTHRQLHDNELFEIRIDRLVDKWSGSIEVGITTHNPATLQFPATMTNMRSGTIMMSGCGILTNGKGTRREYGEYNLDELTEGDRIGLMRKNNGKLYYYINGIDQGVAADKVPTTVFGVVDLYGMTVKVTIVDRDDGIEQGLANHRNNTLIREYQLLNGPLATDELSQDGSEKLLFHSHCGTHAAVISGGKTAHRPVANDNFDNAVVLTNRPLKSNELFEVRLDVMIAKWAGSLEIGVTSHSPQDLDFPSTMTNIRSGTWMMTGNGIMHNGTTVIDDYGQNLDRLNVGDRVGVIRKDTGALHFYVNEVDQGIAATNVPEKIYGVIDLYGQATQCTITDHSEFVDDSAVCGSSSSNLLFHHLHGRNSRISVSGLTASRVNAHGEFNDAIVISNRPLRDDEMFEVILDKMVDRWSGSIEAGVTLIKPQDLEFPSTMTDIDYYTWMLSGSAIMQDGATVRNGYKCDLDSLGAGTRIGMMRCVDGTLHYFINGEDMGVACHDIPTGVYAVIDLYGQCAQVTIIPSSSCLSDSTTSPPTHTETLRPSIAEGSDTMHCFNACYGKNIILSNNNIVASRIRGFNHGLVFSSSSLQFNELFEIQVQQVSYQWSGSLQIGLTTHQFSESYPAASLPPHAGVLLDSGDTWLVSGTQIRRNGRIVRDNYGPSLDYLEIGDRIGVKLCSDCTMHVYRNGIDMGVAATSLPKKVCALVDLYGSVEKISILSKVLANITDVPRERRMSLQSVHSKDSLEEAETMHKEGLLREFHENHGRNILLSHNNTFARRTASYNQGVVLSVKPLVKGHLFQVRIERLNPSWSSSLLIGVTAHPPEKSPFAVTALGLKKTTWIICGDSVFYNGVKVKGRYGPNLDSLQIRHLVGILIDSSNQLHLYVNGIDQGVAAKDIHQQCYAVVDVYGQCEEVSIASSDEILNHTLESNHREKADLEHGWKEKVLKPPNVEPVPVKNCEYQNACIRFKTSLGLPDGYFLPEHSMCYCETCYKIRGDEAYYRKGDPPKDYAVPFGWCQFSLRMTTKSDSSSVLDKWHVAFHGTQPAVLRKIFDCGQLLLPEDAALGASSKNIPLKNKSKDIDGEASQICFSPTIRYAADSIFTPKFEFLDPKSKKRLFARTVIQVLVQPGAYNSGPQRIGAREPIDGHFSNADIEWFTKERGATILHSLLVKIEV